MRDGLAFARRRAEKAVARAHGVDESRRWLLQVATQEAEEWKKVAEKMRPDFEAARAAACDCAVGAGTGDPVLEKELRNLNRLATTAQNRADKLQGNLEALVRKRDNSGSPVARGSSSETPGKSNAARTGRSRSAASHPESGSVPVSAGSNDSGFSRGNGSATSAGETSADRGADTSSSQRTAILDASQRMKSQSFASISEVSDMKSDVSQPPAERAESGPVRLTASERKLLKMLRKVPDSPRRRNDIVRLFGSEKRFREMCAAMDSR